MMLSSLNPESKSVLLAAAKQKKHEAQTEVKPLMSLSQKRLNPFKKSVAKVESSRGLANLDASFAQQKCNKSKHNSIPEQPPPQQTKVHNHHFL